MRKTQRKFSNHKKITLKTEIPIRAFGTQEKHNERTRPFSDLRSDGKSFR